jgi:hypothetical protein
MEGFAALGHVAANRFVGEILTLCMKSVQWLCGLLLPIL